ncbi:GFA family protein [Azospirillum thermophilum]|uniref:GFA family protein n=1 Tax=Azospirillum thermophilum TaxID=2202148 RepID=A0A2S2CSA1_9PROT|nr:GFA family protein [Azospirillum thermophilum]AWK87250.1 GFA family protein [Azospirillum thermophilum]
MTDHGDSGGDARGVERTVWTGGCACGSVRYEVSARPSPVTYCHCGQCRRQHGLAGAYVQVPRTAFRLLGADTLAWYDSSQGIRRGFCARCGGGLFWDRRSSDGIDLTAGSLDQPTSLSAERHIWVEFKADYETLGTDGLPRHSRDSRSPQIAGPAGEAS